MVDAACSETPSLDADIISFIEECNAKEHSESYLIAVLHRVQSHYGWLCTDHLDEVSQRMQIPAAVVSGVATFYHFFRLEPKGKYEISVCMGTACFVKGADKVLDAFRNELGIDVGETSPDGVFSIEESRCIGVCAMAPVVTINGRVFGNVTPKQVSPMLHKLQDEEESAESAQTA